MPKTIRTSVTLLTLSIIAAVPFCLAAETILHTERSLYRNITVYESDDERCMRFTKQISARQSCISLKDPSYLVFDYTKIMLGALYLQPAPDKILIIGLGGGTLPSTLSRILPKAKIDTVEIDPAVVRVAQKYFNFRMTPAVTVSEEDGRVFVKRAVRKGLKYDLIMLDAFDHEYIPEHLLTQEFLREVKQIMTPGGVLVSNTWSSSRLYDHESVTYESVFGRFFNLRHGNRIILIKNDGLSARSVITKNAEALEARFKPFGVGADFLLPLFSTNRDWRVDARVLTDQYSPSNLLNAH
jgi:spermidine synthase